MKLHEIMIGMVMTVAIVTGMFIFISDGVVQYNPVIPSDWNRSFVAMQGVIDDINQTTSEMRDGLTSIETKSGETDYLGAFFNNAYNSIKLAITVPLGAMTMVDAGLSELPLGAFGIPLKTYLYTSLIILVFVGILMHAVVKSDRL